MRKITLLFIIAFIINLTGFSQTCLPEGIVFTTQVEIDNFQINYPGCTEIEGEVEINGKEINNLNGLSVLTTIGKSLFINENHSLTSLSGLESLTSIGESLIIWLNPILTNLSGLDNVTFIGISIHIGNNNSLTSLSGLEKLTTIEMDVKIIANNSITNLSGLDNLSSIGKDLDIFNNYALLSLSGLENLISIGKNLQIQNNPVLTSLSSLNNLTSICNDVYITDNYALINLSGLENLTSIGKYSFIIENNDALVSLTGLDNLTSIIGSLYILNNDALTSLTDLDNVTSIGGILMITDNNNLKKLTGIDNIDAEPISGLHLNSNSLLSECEVKSICDFISNPTGIIEIYDNATGCNSQEEIEIACKSGWIPDINNESEFMIFPNPAQNKIFISAKEGNKIIEVNIFNQLGQKVISEKQLTNVIDISKLRQGIYIIELVSDNSRIREKLIVK